MDLVMINYTIGLATLEELSTIPDIELRAAQSIPSIDLPPHLAEESTPPGALRRACLQQRLWVARVEGSVVGFIVASFKDESPYIRELDVLPNYQRGGIGAALVREVIAWVKRKGLGTLTLTTFRHLPFNAPFYKRFGFVELPMAAQGPALKQQLLNECRRGLDPHKRIAMRLQL